jgi:glycosyltransferase 2 family protein
LKRWALTAISFAAVIGVSIYAVRSSAPHGARLTIPPLAHLLAFLAFAVEVAARSLKLTWSARAVGTRLPFTTSLRTSLGGDFAASITPARVGAEPARFLILAQAGITASDAMVVLYTELVLEMISLMLIVVLIAVLFAVSAPAFIAMIGVVGGYATFVVSLGVLGVILSRRPFGEEPPAWAKRIRLHGRRWEMVQRWSGRVRATVEAFKRMHLGWAALSFLASFAHIAIRFTILPAMVYTMTKQPVALAPLVIWPLGIIYGAGVVPAPGGGGAVELTFRAALGRVIPPALFAPALLWWRFYTFYIYIIIGGLVAGNTALRAVREVEEAEEELERG